MVVTGARAAAPGSRTATTTTHCGLISLFSIAENHLVWFRRARLSRQQLQAVGSEVLSDIAQWVSSNLMLASIVIAIALGTCTSLTISRSY